MTLANGTVTISRSVQIDGRMYSVMFMRPGPEQLARLKPTGETPPEAAGEAFVQSFSVPAPAPK